MTEVVTSNSSVPLDASKCAVGSHSAAPCAAPTSTTLIQAGQQHSSSAAQAAVASSLGGNAAEAGVSVSATAHVAASSRMNPDLSISRALTAMTPLSRSAATPSTISSSPTTSPIDFATPSTSASALGLTPIPQDSAGSREHGSAESQGPDRAHDEPLDQDRPGQGSPEGGDVIIKAQDTSQQDQDGEDQDRQGQDSQGRGGPSQDNRGQGNRGQNNQGQNNRGQGNRGQNQGQGNRGQNQGQGNRGQNQGQGNRGQNNQGQNKQGQNNQGQNSPDKNKQGQREGRETGRETGRDGERTQRPPQTQRQATTQDSVPKSAPPQSKESTSSTSSTSSTQPSTSTSVSTSTSQTTEITSQPLTSIQESAAAPKETQGEGKSTTPAPQNAQLTPATSVSQSQERQSPAPTEEAIKPPVAATQSRDSEQPTPAPTSDQPTPPESSSLTPSDPARLNPESSASSPTSQSSTSSNNSGSTDSQGSVPAPSSTKSAAQIALPIQSATSAISPGPSVVLGDSSPDNPPPNFISPGGKPKGAEDTGGASKTSPAAGKSSQAPRGLPTGGIVGISVGGLAAILLLGVALWLWRKSVAKKRQGIPPGPFGDSTPDRKENVAGEKIGRARGPRRGAEKLAAALGLFKRGSRSRAAVAENPPAGTNEGNAQLWNIPASPRDDVAMSPPMRDGPTIRDRVTGWWVRRADDINPDARTRGDRARSGRNGSIVGAAPEFQARSGRRSLDGPGGMDPFSDTNTSSSNNAAYATIPSQYTSFNPFADPSRRVSPPDRPPAAPPRAHRRSQSASVRESYYPRRSMTFRPDSALRESLQSVTPFADRRNKCRSDPFDLEIESRLIPGADDVAQMPRLTVASSTYSSHTRGSSLPYSQYSSGVSLSDWSVMGADMGLSSGPPVEGQGRRGDLASWSSDKGRPQGGPGVGQAL